MPDQASEVEGKLRAIPFSLRQRIDAAILRHAEMMASATVPLPPEPRVSPVVPQAKPQETPQGMPQNKPSTVKTPTAPRAFQGQFFRPSEALRNDSGAAQPYQNNEPRAVPAATVPEAENTSLFLTNLPPRCDVAMLIGALEALGPVTGRIWHSHVNPPDPPAGHFLSAAKVVFFKRAGARALLQVCQRGGFAVGGRVVHAQWNRYAESPDYVAGQGQGQGQGHDDLNNGGGAAAPPPPPPPPPPSRELSRVVRFEGPHALVGRAALGAFFGSKFKFQTVKVVQVRQTGATRCLEWHFGGYHPQAQWAVMAVNKERPAVKATYARDPCDVFP